MDSLEELKQLNHEDRHASKLDSAETIAESERGQLKDSKIERGRKASESQEKVGDNVQLGSLHRLNS